MVSPKRTVKTQPEDKLANLLAVLEARTKLLAFFFGLCFVTALLVLSIWFPNPTSFQYTVFRITLALAAAGIAGVIPGMIRLKVQPGTALMIHAGGALAVFVIVYLVAPAALPSESSLKDKKKEVKAAASSGTDRQTVLINNNQGGNIQINNYGPTKEEFENILKKQREEFEKRKQSANANADRIQVALLEQQIKELNKKLADIPKSYEEERKRRMAADGVLYLQNTAITLAINHSDEEYQSFAANVILRWKQIYTDEEKFQRQQLALSDVPEIVRLKKRITETQGRLSQALRQPEETQDIADLIEKANQDETVMMALMPHYRRNFEIMNFSEQVLSNLPADSGLIEYRFFQPVDFKTGNLGERHLAALLLSANSDAKQQIIFRDLGEIKSLLQEDGTKSAEIYNRLLAPFDDQINNLKQLYIAPDGPLYLLIFASLRLPDGRFLVERQQINQLQTGRDLLQADKSTPPSKGIVIIGGAKYGDRPAGTAEPASTLAAAYQQRAACELAQGLAYLPESRREAQTIGEIFAMNTGEQAAVLIGDDASEYNLKHLKPPPRILHVSTYSFYFAQEEQIRLAMPRLAEEAPLLLSGLALAGANNGLQGRVDAHGDDGLLYSLEVLGVNLHGTELVSLSADETGKGVVDYSEGVYGLVRAFRTAGAKSVLMTLTPVGDKSSREFMQTFYDKWLSSETSISPAEALHQTRLQFIHDKKPVKDWAPFVLVGK